MSKRTKFSEEDEFETIAKSNLTDKTTNKTTNRLNNTNNTNNSFNIEAKDFTDDDNDEESNKINLKPNIYLTIAIYFLQNLLTFVGLFFYLKSL